MVSGRARHPARVCALLGGLLVVAPLWVGVAAAPAGAATPSAVPGATSGATAGATSGATVSGTVFSDTDGNGQQDSDDTGIAGLAVTVTDGSGNAAGTTTGSGPSAGQWSVTGLAAGSYTVTVATPAGSALTTAGQPGGDDPAAVTLTDGESAAPLMTGFRGPDQPPAFAPSSNNSAQTINSGTGLARLTASDPNNDPLTYSTSTPGGLPAGISLAADGTFTGVATNTTNQTRTYPGVPVTVDDGHGGTAQTSLAVTVLPAADTAPVANPDTADTPPATAVMVPVLANDTDANGDSLSLISFAQGSRNSGVDCTPAGLCTFTPAAAVTQGRETFSYVVGDGRGGTATGVVTVTIDNVKPVFTSAPVNTAQSVPVGTALAPVQAVDGNGDPVTYTVTTGTASLPPGVTGVDADGSFAGVPTTAGTYHPVIQADDGIAGGGAPATTTVTVTVSTAAAAIDNKPVAMPDSYPAAGAPPITPGIAGPPLTVLANDTDADGDPLSIIDFDSPTTGGTVALGPGGSTLVYTPRAGFIGTDHFTYTVSDGKPGGTDSGRVTVVVSAPADQPPAFTTAAANSNQTVPSGTALTALSAQDPDTDAGLLRYSVSSGVLPVGVTLDAATGAFGGLVSNATTTDETYTVTVTVSDGTLTNVTPQTLVILVRPQPTLDRAPTPQPDAASVPNGTPVTVDVLANDTDPDGDPLTISAFDPVSADGGAVSCTTATGCTYTPAAGTRGDDTFTYTVSDGVLSATATVTITVDTAQTPLVRAVDDTSTTVSPSPVVIAVTANDTDSAGYPLTVSLVTQPSHGAVTCSGHTCTYTPTTGFTGDDTFTYLAADGQGGSGSATVAIAVVAPTIPTVTANPDAATTPAGQPVTVPVTANDLDSAGLVLAVIPAGQPAHGLLSCQQGSCTYTPDAGFSGTDGFTYSASDGAGGTAVGSVVITVLPSQVLRSKLLAPVLVAGPVTVSLPVGYHPHIPIGGSLVAVKGKLPPGTSISSAGVFQGVATTAGHYAAIVTIRYRGAAITRRLTVTVSAASIGAAPPPAQVTPLPTAEPPTAETTEPAPSGAPALAMTGAGGIGGLLDAALGLTLLGVVLRRTPRPAPSRRG